MEIFNIEPNAYRYDVDGDTIKFGLAEIVKTDSETSKGSDLVKQVTIRLSANQLIGLLSSLASAAYDLQQASGVDLGIKRSEEEIIMEADIE